MFCITLWPKTVSPDVDWNATRYLDWTPSLCHLTVC